jgi:hypothetical protein
MNKSRQALLAGFGIVALVLTLVLVLNNAASAKESVERPFKMVEYGYVIDEGPDGVDCPVIKVEAGGDGNATHMGLVSITRTHCFDIAADQPISDGYWEAEGANGDKIWGSYAGVLVPTEFGENGPIRGTITSPFTIDGGTGRFEGATGEGVTTSDYDMVADEGEFVSEGTIVY